MMETVGVDRLDALYTGDRAGAPRRHDLAVAACTAAMADPMPMMTMFDKQIQLRMGQANVHRWVPDILPLLLDGDPLGVDDFATHRLPLEAAPEAYATFQKKADGAVKVVFQPYASTTFRRCNWALFIDERPSIPRFLASL